MSSNIVVLGKFVNHKGRNRHFTSPEELEQERKAEESKKWRKKKTNEDGEEESASGSDAEEAGSDESEEEESDSEDDRKKSGVHGLIEIENPNRVHKKAVLKVSTLDAEVGASSSSAAPAVAAAPTPVADLSRREREEIERQKKQANYQKLHAQGKTEQARADLARLAIIKQQREEAALKRDAKKKEAEMKSKGGK